MEKKSDGELMALLGKGNKRAFDEIFRRYSGPVLGYCSRLAGARAIGEDISQEVWIRTVKNAGTYQARSPLKSWLFTIARNLCLNYLRSQKKLVFSMDDKLEELDRALTADSMSRESVEDMIAKVQNEQLVRNAIDTLPSSQRIALVLWMSDNASYESIAQDMRISVSALRSLLHRSRESLEKALSKKDMKLEAQ